jgi:hypothetical protein
MAKENLLDLLREARNELSVLASYVEDPDFAWPNLGLKMRAKAQKELRDRLDAALKSNETFGSTVLAFQRGEGQWRYAVSPGVMSCALVDFKTQEEAVAAANKVVAANGWPAVPEETVFDVTPKPVALPTHSFTGPVTFNSPMPVKRWTVADLAEPDENVRTLHTNASDHMKCASRDCWLCHGVPESAGPR